MAFVDESYWVAVAAAAPVVALAHVVAIGDIHRARIRAIVNPAPVKETLLPAWRRLSTRVGILALFNVGWDATALVMALLSLDAQSNAMSPALTAFLLGVSLLQVVTIGRLTTLAVARDCPEQLRECCMRVGVLANDGNVPT